jgi:hypothetical protein
MVMNGEATEAMEKRLAKLKGNGIITEEDVHEIEKACDNEDKMRASIESAIKKRQEIDANLKESRLQFDNNILRLHDLRLQYEEVFRSLYDQKVSIEANERIQNSLRKIIVLLTEKEDADISEAALLGREGGLGILLIKKLMDNVSYRYSNGKNELTIVKRK